MTNPTSPRARAIARVAAVATLALTLLVTTMTGTDASILPAVQVAPAADPVAATIGDRAGFAPGSEFMSLSPTVQAMELDAMRDAGASWLRVGVQWSQVEALRGVYSWGGVDSVIRLALERGIEPIVMIAYTPAWARATNCFSQYCPPATDGTYANFVRRTVTRYLPYGVDTYEIWNEPNIDTYWSPAPNVARYTTMLQAASAAAKSVDPSVTVLSGGMAPASNDTTTKTRPSTFLTQMYALGAGPSFDGVGMHPYAYPVAPTHPAPWNAFYTLPWLRQIMETNGDAAKKIWMTEFGYSTGLWNGATTEADQAAFLTEAYRAIAEVEWAGPLIWFNLRDRGVNPMAREENFGLVTYLGVPKPALQAYTDVTREPAFTQSP